MSYVNLHAHNMYSAFDGFGTAKHHAAWAAKIGQNALGTSNHGNMSNMVEHYEACNAKGIKPVLGVEAYFIPKFRHGLKTRCHILLFAMSNKGVSNLMQAITEANRDKFYRYPIMDWETLNKYNEDVICLTGCLSGPISRLIEMKEWERAENMALKFKSVFGDRLYLEVQPFDVGEQKTINSTLIEFAAKHDIKVVMTSDSHYMRERDYDTYQMMHTIAGRPPGHGGADYSLRWMHTEEEMLSYWTALMGFDGQPFIDETQALAGRCDVELSNEVKVPVVDWGMPSKKKLQQAAVEGLRRIGKFDSEEYRARVKHEISVVCTLGFEDYFLLCFDIMQFARKNSIRVNFGRGSVGGSLLAYLLGIIEFDPLVLGCSFDRFLRYDKKSMPDIDLDFDSNRRQEIIDYIMQKYAGKAAPITTYGYYRIKNLINDLCKEFVVEDEEKALLTSVIDAMEPKLGVTPKQIKARDRRIAPLSVKYPGLLKHFCKLFGQIRFTGRHAGGVAIAATEIEKVVALQRIRGELQTSFDMNSLMALGCLKMDILGLSTVSVVADCESAAGVTFSMDKIDDPVIMQYFKDADTNGIFQFEKRGAKQILKEVQPDNLQELIACVSLNRPAPLSLGMPSKYADAKAGNFDDSIPWWEYVKDTYGVLLYQEHVMNICKYFANMEWADVDKIMKGLRAEAAPELKKKFVEGATATGKVDKASAEQLWDNMTLYLFNKGHGSAYALLAYWCAWLRHYHPLEFFFAALKNEHDTRRALSYEREAVKRGVVVFLPHVNGGVKYTIKEVDGDKIIQEGLTTIEGVGSTTAEAIINGGPYTSLTDFMAKLPKGVGPKMVETLTDSGALEFDKITFYNRCIQYCATRLM